MTDRDDATARAAAYAVNAASEAERAETEALRTTDSALDAEIGEFAETAALLGLAVAPVTPSAALRASVLAAVDADIAATAAADAAAKTATSVAASAEAKPAATLTPAATVTAIRPWFRRPSVLIASVAAAGALLFGGTAVAIGISQSPPAQVSAVDQVLQAQDAQRVTAAVAGGGTATWVWSAELARSVVLVDDLPVLAVGQTYQFWYIDESGAAPSNTFAGGTHQVAVDGTMPADAQLAVTVEPDGGSLVPSSDPIVVIASA